MCFWRLLPVTQIVEYAPRQFTVSTKQKKDPIKSLSYFRIVACLSMAFAFSLVSLNSGRFNCNRALRRIFKSPRNTQTERKNQRTMKNIHIPDLHVTEIVFYGLS